MLRTSSPPPAPDYISAEKQQGEANLSSELQSAQLSNPNITSPYGNQSVTYADAEGMTPHTMSDYNQAMADWSANPATHDRVSLDQFIQAPNQPTVTQTLTPEAQKTLDYQQQVQQALSQLGLQGVSTAQNVMGTPFQWDQQMQTSLGTPGQMQNSVADAGSIDRGPGADQYGLAANQLNLQDVAKLPVNAGQTGQAAIMARLQPQINQQPASLEQNLANRGVPRDSVACDQAFTEQSQRENDLLSQASLIGIN